MSLVLDASLALAWLFDDECTPVIDAVPGEVSASGAHVPSLWRLEVANSLRTALGRGRVDLPFGTHALRRLTTLPIVVDPDTAHSAWGATLGLSDRFGLTLYDAATLELAQRRALPLASLDRDLRTAADALGVPLRGLAP